MILIIETADKPTELNFEVSVCESRNKLLIYLNKNI